MSMSKNEVSKFNQYVDPSNTLSNKDIVRATWYLKHKATLRKIFFGSIITIVSLLNIFGLYGWSKYLFFGTVQDQQLSQQTVRSIVNYLPIQKYYKPVPLDISNINVTQPTTGRFDFSAEVKNANKRKIAEIDFYFTYDGGQTEIFTASIMPNSQRPIVSFGQKANGYPTSVQIAIADIRWRAINPHDLFDIDTYISKRVQFSFTDFQFLSQSEAQDRPANSIQFVATNNSTYSYWNLPIIVKLNRGSETVGFLQTALSEFVAGQSRAVDLRSVANGLTVTDIEVFSIQDYFDIDVYMPPQVGQ